MCTQLEAIFLKHRDISLMIIVKDVVVLYSSVVIFGFQMISVICFPPVSLSLIHSLAYRTRRRSVVGGVGFLDFSQNMESAKSNRKNNFSIENILSRPETSHKVQHKFMRQNPFQNNHVLFDQNRRFSEVQCRRYESEETENELKNESELSCHSETAESVIDNETNSEIASDDGGNCSNQCKEGKVDS